MSAAVIHVVDALAEPVSWAVIHTLWQGGLIALGLYVTLFLLRRTSAAVRYAVSCAALLALFVLAVGTALVLITEASQSWPSDLSMTAGLEGDQVVSVARTVIGGPAAGAREVKLPGSVPGSLLQCVSLSWFLGVLSLSLYHMMGWRRTRQMTRLDARDTDPTWLKRFHRLCSRLGLTRRVRLLESGVARSPCVVGWLRPTVLVPVSALTGLSTSQLELILAHEIAHIRRHDVLINYLQTIIETLLFHNPAAWWISRQIRTEREHCCDDFAADVCGSRILYARALVNLEESRRANPSFSMAVNGVSIMNRIRRLAGQPAQSGYQPVVGMLNVLSLAMLLGAGMILLDCQTAKSASAAPIVPEPARYEPSQHDIQGRWTIEPRQHGRIQLMMTHGSRSRFGSTMAPDELHGLTAGENRTFQLERDAGTFFFEGDVEETAGSYAGSGRWYFQASSSYVESLNNLGFEVPNDEKSLELAIHDVTLDFVHGLDREGYRGFSLSKLIELHIHDVTPEYIHALAELGYKNLSLSKLVEMQIHDVTPEYVGALADLGYRDLSASKLVEMQIHDVSPEFVRDMVDLGYKDLSASKLIEWQIHDVNPEFIHALNELGYRNLNPSKLVEMRIHDVEPSYIRELAELGYDNLSPNKLVEMKIHDVTPRFIRRLRDRGFEDLTPDRLIELKIHGTF